MKRFFLSQEEWLRLAVVTPQEKKRAALKVARWVNWAISAHGFDPEYGPFSKANVGGDPVKVITEECVEALFCGEWHWKPTRELSSQLINIAKSKMSHIIEHYYRDEQPKVKHLSDIKFREEVEMNLAAQWKFEANMREMGYEMARDAVRNKPELLAYLDALYEDDDYHGIASRLGVDVATVKKLEKKLLSFLANM